MGHRTRTNRSLGLALLAFLLAGEAHSSITDPAITSAVEQSAGNDFTLVWSDPAYLLQDFGFTPVVEAGLARFQNPSGVDVAAMLLLLTQVSAANPSGLYPHDYRVCQSIHASSLVSLSRFQAGGGEFLMMEMAQPSVHEFAATLLVREDNGSYLVDSQIFSVLYDSGSPGRQYTFQIWSKDPTTTQTLVGKLLSALAGKRPLTFRNSVPRALPVAVARRIQMTADRILLELEAPQAVPGLDVTVVSWEYPNPSPTVTHTTLAVPAGRSFRLLPVTAETTDVQVYLDYQGALQDKVFTSFNAWGPLASGWFPFSDATGSTVAIQRAPLSGLLPSTGEAVMSTSTVKLSGSLAPGGFLGMYADVLPALQFPGDLRAYDRWIVRARQSSSSSILSVEMKLELDDGSTRSTFLSLGSSWTQLEIPVSRFGNWDAVGAHIERVVLAVTSPPGALTLDIDRLSLRRKDLPFTDGFESGGADFWSSKSP